MARKKTESEKFEEIINSVDAGKKVPEECLDSNRAKEKSDISPEELDTNSSLKLEICDRIEKINNRYYLLIIKKYIDKLGG